MEPQRTQRAQRNARVLCGAGLRPGERTPAERAPPAASKEKPLVVLLFLCVLCALCGSREYPSMYTETLTQRIGLTAAINPQVINNQTKTTGGVDLSVFHRALFLLEIGAVTGGGTISAKLQEST